MEKVAIFGGTFDPLHMGHLNLARQAVAECGLDRLIFMPNYISPFKTDADVSSGEIRYEMLREILDYDPAFSVTDYEIKRSEISYTYDTLSHFRDELDADMYFVLGFDSILELDKWYMGPSLISEFSFISARRPGFDDREGLDKISEYERLYGTNIIVLDMEPFDASSTDIRSRIKRGMPIEDLVPPEIKRYIDEHGLYR